MFFSFCLFCLLFFLLLLSVLQRRYTLCATSDATKQYFCMQSCYPFFIVFPPSHPSLASCIYPSTMAVQFCFWQWNSHGSMRLGYLQVPLGKRFSCRTRAHMQPIAVQFWHGYSILLLARWSDNKSGSAGDACSGPRVKKTAKSMSARALATEQLFGGWLSSPTFSGTWVYIYIYIYICI